MLKGCWTDGIYSVEMMLDRRDPQCRRDAGRTGCTVLKGCWTDGMYSVEGMLDGRDVQF